ncbi:MAG: macro domain-containing protein [Pseudomonadales bacterium]
MGDILACATDTVVAPANSYGYMDGGIDKDYQRYFGPSIEITIQDAIRHRNDALLEVGAAIVVSTGNDRIPRMIVAPTMLLPQAARPQDCFYAMAAILNAYDRNRSRIEHIYSPGLGTGVGQVDPDDSAREMASAYGKWVSRGRKASDA